MIRFSPVSEPKFGKFFLVYLFVYMYLTFFVIYRRTLVSTFKAVKDVALSLYPYFVYILFFRRINN